MSDSRDWTALYETLEDNIEQYGVESELLDDEYARKYDVDGFLACIRARLIKTKPKNPLLFLERYLEHIDLQREAETDIFSFWSPQSVSEHQGEQIPAPLSNSRESLHRIRGLSKNRRERHLQVGVGLDIGGTLVKIVVFDSHDGTDELLSFIKSSDRYGSTGIRDERLAFQWGKGTFHFIQFETKRVENAIELLKEHGVLGDERLLFVTGGGALKYASLISEHLECELVKGDELACLLVGLNFVLHNVPEECYYLEDHSEPETSIRIPMPMSQDDVYPYLLVNIGSGVSILIVESQRSFHRVSGTSVGGGTFLGLVRLLTQVEQFSDAVELAKQGDSRNVDMLVKDIYGDGYPAFNLSGDTVASSFGKVSPEAKREDIAASLLKMIGINIAQLAYLCAMRYKVTRLIFAGSFLRENAISMGSLSFSIDYWGHGLMRALFLQHEGYCGSIGAFLLQEVSTTLTPSAGPQDLHISSSDSDDDKDKST